MKKKINMKRFTINGLVDCIGEFAIERAGYKFYFVTDGSTCWLIEYSTGVSAGEFMFIKEYAYKKKLLKQLDLPDYKIKKAIENQIPLLKQKGIEYPVNK